MSNNYSPSVKKYLAEIEECFEIIDDFETIKETVKARVESERDYLDYLARLMITHAVNNVRASYDSKAEAELISTVWYLYWSMPQIRVVSIEQNLKEAIGEILTKDILMHVKNQATIEVACDKCGEVSRVQVKSRTALKQVNSPRPWNRPLCDSCQEIKDREREEFNERLQQDRIKRSEQLRELQTMPYQEYLQTEEWQDTRKAALKRARYHCQVCNDEGELHVHHRTYERRGNEYASDLIVLCKKCHETYHFPES